MSNIIIKDGFDFSFDELKCGECEGVCCIGERGFIWLNSSEMKEIAKFLQINLDEFKDKYLKKVNYKYSIKEKRISEKNYECLFFDRKIGGCTIYNVRPKQCRTYPFWEYFKNNTDELMQECIAITEIKKGKKDE